MAKKKMSWDIPVDEMWEKFEAAVKGETPRGMAMVHAIQVAVGRESDVRFSELA